MESALNPTCLLQWVEPHSMHFICLRHPGDFFLLYAFTYSQSGWTFWEADLETEFKVQDVY